MSDLDNPDESRIKINIHELGIQMPALQIAYKEPSGGRNAPCPCGSRKKFKKCHGNSRGGAAVEKPRQQKITFKLAEPITINADEPEQVFIKIDPFSKDLEVISHGNVVTPRAVEIERNYAREKGPKIITTATVDGADAHFDFGRALSAYEMCFGVDTNTREIQGERVSITGTTTFDPSQDPLQAVFIYPSLAFEIRSPKGSPEKVGWILAIHAILRSPNFDPQKHYCIVVDSHLDELPAINRRYQPILEGHVLPAQFYLIYASADAGSDTQNKLIKYADWCATEVFKLVEAGTAAPELDGTPDDLSVGRRNLGCPYPR